MIKLRIKITITLFLGYVASEEPGYDCIRSPDGVNYRGPLSKANNSKTCLPWASMYSDSDFHEFPDDLTPEEWVLTNRSGCRNPKPLERERPWCYTSLEEWNYCDIPLCVPEPLTGGTYYIRNLYGCRGNPGHSSGVDGAWHCRKFISPSSNNYLGLHAQALTWELVPQQEKNVFKIRSGGKYWSYYSWHDPWLTVEGEEEDQLDWEIRPRGNGWSIRSKYNCEVNKWPCNVEVSWSGFLPTQKYLKLMDDEFVMFDFIKKNCSVE